MGHKTHRRRRRRRTYKRGGTLSNVTHALQRASHSVSESVFKGANAVKKSTVNKLSGLGRSAISGKPPISRSTIVPVSSNPTGHTGATVQSKVHPM